MDKLPSKQVSFIKVNAQGNEEIYDGLIQWNNNIFYFKFQNEFDNGNRYFVYDDKNPIFWFSILTTPDDYSEEDIYMGDVLS